MNARGAVDSWVLRGVALAGIGLTLWTVTLVALSLHSDHRRLALGEEKAIGGFDPHLKLALVAATRVDAPEGLSAAIGADAHWLRVEVRARNDAAGALRIDPAFLRVEVLDLEGRRYRPVVVRDAEGRTVFGDGLTGTLDAGEQRVTPFIFALPPAARAPALWIRDRSWIARLIPGSETSFFHGRVTFELP